jgi:coenzyme F420-reducing hydrogenase beta subunit
MQVDYKQRNYLWRGTEKKHVLRKKVQEFKEERIEEHMRTVQKKQIQNGRCWSRCRNAGKLELQYVEF